jgi:hypothetical protein
LTFPSIFQVLLEAKLAAQLTADTALKTSPNNGSVKIPKRFINHNNGMEESQTPIFLEKIKKA